MKYFVLLAFFMIPWVLKSQVSRKHDSILSLLDHARHDSQKVIHYLHLGDLYQFTRQDTALYYYHKALNLAKDSGWHSLTGQSYNYIGILHLCQSEYDHAVRYLKASLSSKRQVNDTGGIANIYNNLGIIYKNRGRYEKALEAFQNVIKLRDQLSATISDSTFSKDNLQKIAHAHNNRGNVYYQFGNYREAVTSYRNSLAFYNKINDQKGIAACYNNIGNVFEEQENYDRALDYYHRALRLNQDIKALRNIGVCFNNIGEIYLKRNAFKEAGDYYQKSLELREELKDKRGLSAVYTNLAVLEMKQGAYERSLDFFYKALKLDYEIGDKKGRAEDLGYIARVYLKMNALDETIYFAERSARLADSIEARVQEKSAYELLSLAYELKGNYKQALAYNRMFEEIEDYMFNRDKNQWIIESESKFRLKEIQKKLDKTRILLEHKKSMIKKHPLWNYGLGGLSLLLCIILIYNFRIKKIKDVRKSRSNKKQAYIAGEKQISSADSQIYHPDEDLKIGKRNHFEENLFNEHKADHALTFGYAANIQSMLLPSSRYIKKLIPEYFIFYQPKEDVSGDFYWLRENGDLVMVLVIDCMGHGVEATLFQLFVFSFLNDIFHYREDIHTDQMLNELRTYIVQTLSKNEDFKEHFAIMNISLCLWNRKTHLLEYSSTANPLYVIHNKKLTEFKTTRIPMGTIYKLEVSFTASRLVLAPGDTIYLFTDGYYNQLNGESHKKMTRRRFKAHLMEIGSEDLNKQKVLLEDFFNQWKKDYEQVDDVLVMGMRFL